MTVVDALETNNGSYVAIFMRMTTWIAYRNDGRIGIPRDGNKDCTMVAAAPVLPAGYVVNASRVADRRIVLAGYRLADLLRRVVASWGESIISLPGNIYMAEWRVRLKGDQFDLQELKEILLGHDPFIIEDDSNMTATST
jgi:hypothetical protein